jgi:hypothetical protein
MAPVTGFRALGGHLSAISSAADQERRPRIIASAQAQQ